MNDTTALLIVDVQYGFMPGGGLAVADGDAVVPVINRVARRFTNVVLTQDWHPANHVSFAVNHPGRAPFETITLPYGEQVLWPVHCVQGTHAASRRCTCAGWPPTIAWPGARWMRARQALR